MTSLLREKNNTLAGRKVELLVADTGGNPAGAKTDRATQHKAIDDYGDQSRIVRRVTIDGPVSVGIDGRHGKTRNGSAEAAAAA